MPAGVLVALAVLVGITGLLAVGAYLLYRGWTGSLFEGHPRCKACRYDLYGHGLRPQCCPECAANLRQAGAVVVSVRDLRSTPTFAGAACILLAIGSLVAMCIDTGAVPAPVVAPVARVFAPPRQTIIVSSYSASPSGNRSTVTQRRPRKIETPREPTETHTAPTSIQSALNVAAIWAVPEHKPDEIWPDAVVQEARDNKQTFADLAPTNSTWSAPSEHGWSTTPAPLSASTLLGVEAWSPVGYSPKPIAAVRTTATPYSTATRAVQRADVRVSPHTLVKTNTFQRTVKPRHHGR